MPAENPIEEELRELRRDCGYDGYDEFQDDPEFVKEHGDGGSVDALINYKDALENLVYQLSN
jgi:hypothetical protein